MNKIHPLSPPPSYDSVVALKDDICDQKIIPVTEIKNHFSLNYDINDNEIIINVKNMLKNIDYILVINDKNENWNQIKKFFQNNFNNLLFIIKLLFENNNYNIYYDIHYDIHYNDKNILIFNIIHNNIINDFNIHLDFMLLNNYIQKKKEKEIDTIINEFIEEEKL